MYINVNCFHKCMNIGKAKVLFNQCFSSRINFKIWKDVHKRTFATKISYWNARIFFNNRLLFSSCLQIKNMLGMDNEIYIFKRFLTAQNFDKKYDYNLIYTGEFTRMVRIVKIFSLTTSMIGLALQPVLFQQMQESLPIGLTMMLVTNLFVFLTPFLLHLITKRYVIEILYNSTTKTFIAMTYSIFLNKKTHLFSRDEAVDGEGTHMLANIVIHKKIPLFFDPTAFTDKQAYVYLMKYDEPLEWQIHEDKLQMFEPKDEKSFQNDSNKHNKSNYIKSDKHNTQNRDL